MTDTAALVDRAYDELVALHGPPPRGSGPRRAWFRKHRAEMRAMCAAWRAEEATRR